MYSNNQTDLLETIFRVFPKARIVHKSEPKPFKSAESTVNGNPALAKRTKPQVTVSRACKHKVFDSRQLSLFDETKRGGI